MLNISTKKQFIFYTVLIAAIIIIFNLVSRSLFFRLDLTENKMYSLSNSSKSVIEKLDDRMVTKVFFSKDLPGKYANSRRYLQDLLEEYQAYSKGDFHFEFINPDDNQEAQNEARGYGIPPVQLQVVENDKLEIKNVYMGLVLLYSDKKEALPVIQTTEGLEYNLTAAIKKISATDLKKVGIVSPETKEVSTRKLQQLLDRTYSIQKVSLESEIPVDVNTVLMNGVEDSLSMDELYNLDQFLMRGGKLFIGQGRLKTELQQGFAAEIHTNMFEFLEHYGFHIGKDLILDRRCGQIRVQQRHGFFSFANAIEYPPFPLIHNFSKDNIIVKNLEEVQVFFINEISSVDSTANFTSLMKTSDKTGSISGPYYNIYPMRNPQMGMFPLKHKTIAAMVEGNLKSYFANNSEYSQKENFLSQGNDVQILLISDNEFFNDYRAGSIPENTDFILNGIDYLSGDRELLEIRSRGVTARPLDQLSDGARRIWKWLNIFLPALLVVLLGLYRWKRNSNKRKLLEEIYG